MDHPPDKRHCPESDAWSCFYSGKVDEDTIVGLVAHLDWCQPCQTHLRTIGETMADAADPVVAALRVASRGTQEYEIEPEYRRTLEQLQAMLPGAAHARPEAQIPERLGEYCVHELIGRGGMGAVYRATHTRLGREVALKIVSPERASNAAALARFHRETAALGRLDHPNVVRATDAGEVDGVAFLVMDLVEGVDASRLVRLRGPLRVADACELARQAAMGLQHLAEHGLVHRDVKPSNLMLSKRGEVKILDLGLAAARARDELGDGVTGTGQIVGTLDYLAPEQADPGLPVDCRADVYSLGCSLYFLVAGCAPYSGPNHATSRDKILGHTVGAVPDVRNFRPDVPTSLSTVLSRMMAKIPADRFATPADAAAALAPFCVGADLGRLASADIKPIPQVSATPSEEPRESVPQRRRRSTTRIAATALVGLLFAGGGLAGAVHLWVQSPISPDGTELAVMLPADTHQSSPPAETKEPEPKQEVKWVYPVALLGFEERGAGTKDLGPKVGDLLFAKLGARAEFYLVDRIDLKKVLDEQQLNITGAVRADEAAKVGQLTGAKIIVTGSILQVEKKLFLIAKVIGTENGRVVGVSVEGVASDDLAALAGKLAEAVDQAISKNGEKLAPKPSVVPDRVVELGKKLGKGPRPILFVQVGERHVGMPAIDPAAQTEVMRFAKETGFGLVDVDEGGKSKADVLVLGEGFSEVAGRVGGLVSVRARVELKAVDRKTGLVLAVDRQTVVVVDLSEQIAGKTALQTAAADLAERIFPKLVQNEKK